MLILLRQKKVKKESINPPPLPQKKKLKGRITAKFQEVKDIETAPLVSASISKKQSSKSPSQDDQSCLENIIEKIIEKVLKEKFGATIAFFNRRILLSEYWLMVEMTPFRILLKLQTQMGRTKF